MTRKQYGENLRRCRKAWSVNANLKKRYLRIERAQRDVDDFPPGYSSPLQPALKSNRAL